MKRSIYSIKEIYYTIQGEGFHSGRAAIFCRFSGCNLWTGREEDRHKAICQFCDTDFWGTDGKNGGKYTAEELILKFKELVPLGGFDNLMVVFTGGEPALQLDTELLSACKTANYYTAIETNGTIVLPKGIDWICVSPKANTEITVTTGNELKVVIPQEQDISMFLKFDFDHFYVQPMDGSFIKENTLLAINYVKENPQWKLSIQTHKYLGIE